MAIVMPALRVSVSCTRPRNMPERDKNTVAKLNVDKMDYSLYASWSIRNLPNIT